MGKSLLSIIAENERRRIQQKNLDVPTDDVEKSAYKEYAKGFGEFLGHNYSKDKNFESPNVNEVGDKALNDLKDLNVFPQDEYERVNVDLNDASVIDMPEIDEISEDIYLNNVAYNKFSSLDYIPYVAELASGKEQLGDYGEYIEGIKRDLNIRGNTLADIFTGDFNLNDSPIGVIGGQALNTALNLQFSTILERETLGKINNNAFSILQTQSFLRPDYDITVRAQPLERAVEFLTELGGFEFPISYLPQDVFGLERTSVVDNKGVVTYIGSNLSTTERIALLLQYTGKGQQQQLLSLLKLNLYNPEVIGKDETLEANTYINGDGVTVGNLNASDFIATIANTNDTGLGQFEPYGVESIHKKSQVGKLISDTFAWQWINDVPNVLGVGWTANASNQFNPKSLLFKTQELISNNSTAFLDLNDKEFIESANGINRTISRGDSTTASGNYEDDDGTQIQAGEYFRVWTKARGYNRLDRTLRHRGLDNGDTRSVLNDNGLINFAPTTRNATSANGLQADEVIKRYMFSLENLAWADHLDDLPLCEQGAGDPVSGTRGRIMWFPPYDLKISENVSANWESTQFIGRGEPIYTYNNTERSGTLSFTIIVDHPDIVHRLVGEKTEYWERYFKGDKLIEADARAKDTINKKLSPNEIDELEKARKKLLPKPKNNDKENITPQQKEQNVKNKTKEKEDDGSLGDVALSIYFPNASTTVPEGSLAGQFGFLTPRTDLTEADLKLKNIGYEDGGLNDAVGSPVTTSDGRIQITTGVGIRYTNLSTGKVINGTQNGFFTYLDGGTLKSSGKVCTSRDDSPIGYKDRNNLGLNQDFYYGWADIFDNIFFGVKKARVSFVGKASGASPTDTTNNTLSKERAQNAKAWFDKNVLPIYEEIDISTDVAYTGDKDDKLAQAQNPSNVASFCQDCDEADFDPCKRARRVDIFVKILEEDEPEPEPIINDSGDTTIEEDITTENLTQDANEVARDQDDPDDSVTINPDILKKLVYTECDFFNYLETYEPIAYQTISERIKYFWAAYHSITPQGFNSRLTFLQQCLRQGDSVGRDGIENWKNLAFGRPPVCILRIGDFYHTRIIIESMSIDYNEGMNWDLNPEGIGVQPMYADITLNIKILGGSSMTAPINRLQNALSFNYYANTEMYDARADSVVFVDQKNDEGQSDDIATFGTLKNGRIVDGIRLSSITNYSQAEKQAQLAKIRKQSRVTLPNSTTANVDNPETLGQVGSLLETKKRLGLSLTTDEKTTLIVDENVRAKLSTTEITPISQREISTAFDNSLKDENSALTQSVEQLNESGQETDREVVFDLFDAYFPDENLTEDDKSKMLDAYQESLKAQKELINIE